MIEQRYRKAIQIEDSWGDMQWEPNSFELMNGKVVVLQYRALRHTSEYISHTFGEWQDVEVDNE